MPKANKESQPTVVETIEGAVFSIQIHSKEFADNEFLMTSLLRAIAGNAQYSLVSGQRYMDSLDEQAAVNVNGITDPATGEMTKLPNINPDTGEVQALTERQQGFYDSLEQTQELCVDILADMTNEFNSRNDNPQNKLLYKNNAQVSQGITEREMSKQAVASGKSKEVVEAERKMRDERKEKREAKLKAAGIS